MTLAETALVATFIAEFAGDRSRLLDIAHAVQRQFGCIDDAAIQTIAAGIGVHPVEVEDMVSFYALFSRERRGCRDIRLSKTPVAMLKGAQTVCRAFQDARGISIGETSADGAFTLGWTSDIGMADQEPSALVNGMVLTSLSPQDVPGIVAARRQGAAPPNTTSAFGSGIDLAGALHHAVLIQARDPAPVQA
jgi:[NiFe] hydrogenase diaphorase moiety large subunit